jgi:hypothetical protein
VSPGFYRLGNGADGVVVFPPGAEVPETGEKVKGIIEIIDPKGQAHVMYKKMQVVVFAVLGFGDTLVAEVNAGNVEPLFGQVDGVATFTTGHIKHKRTGGRRQPADEQVYKCSRFFLIPLEIELVIIGCIEPIFKPGLLHGTKIKGNGCLNGFCTTREA